MSRAAESLAQTSRVKQVKALHYNSIDLVFQFIQFVNLIDLLLSYRMLILQDQQKNHVGSLIPDRYHFHGTTPVLATLVKDALLFAGDKVAQPRIELSISGFGFEGWNGALVHAIEDFVCEESKGARVDS